jgi:hypothetical protein
MENILVPVLLAILGGFALFGLLVLGVMGVVSFFRAWERGEPEFSSSMPERLDRSPLHSVEARIARGDHSERERKLLRDEITDMARQREAERRRIERGSAP